MLKRMIPTYVEVRRATTRLAALATTLALVAATSTASAQPPAQPYPQPYAQPQPYGQPVYIVQQSDPAQLQALQMRLAQLQAERSQYGVGGPIAMIAVGAGVGAISGLVCMSFALARASEGDTGTLGTDLRRGVRVSGVFTALGLGLAIGGGVRLGHRLRLRRQYNPEIQQIRQQLRMMQGGVVVRASANELSLSLRMPF